MPSHERFAQQMEYSLHQEINELYLSIALRNFATSMITMFGVIFIYKLFGYSLLLTFIFYLIQVIGQVTLVPLTAKLLDRWGLKKMMAVGMPFMGFYFLLLVAASRYAGDVSTLTYLLGLAMICKILYLILYWPPRHIDFAKFSQSHKQGRQISLQQIIVALSKTIAPLVGGIIITIWGFNALFISSALLLFISSIPLFFSPEVYEHYSYSYKEGFQKLFDKKNFKTSLAFFFEGIEYGTVVFIFPLFIYFTIKKFDTIGFITSLSLIITLIFTYLIGWFNDKKGSKKLLPYTSVIHGFAWLLLNFIKTPLQFFFLASLHKLAETANHIPFISTYYHRAQTQGENIDEYIISHELAHNLGRVFLFFIIIIGLLMGFHSWWWYFGLAAISSTLMRVV